MTNHHRFELDESTRRALAEERGLGGKFDLMTDIREGRFARLIVAERNHTNQMKAACEQVFDAKSPFQFELEGIAHGNGFHDIAQREGSYEIWDTDKSDYLDFLKRKLPENRIKHRARNATVVVAGKYSPATL